MTERNPGRQLRLEHHDREVRVSLRDQVFRPALVNLLQRSPSILEALPQFRKERRHVLAHSLRESCEPQYPAQFTLHDVLNLAQPSKEWRYKVVKRFTGGRQPERPPLEKRHAEVFLEPNYLRAHRRLLDPIGNLPIPSHRAT